MKTLIKIKRESENLFAITTYNPNAGKHGRFLLCRDNLENWAGNPSKPFYEEDLYNVLRVDHFHEDEFLFRIKWINFTNTNAGTFNGIQQDFILSESEFYGLFKLKENECARFLHDSEEPRRVTLDFSHAQRTIHKIVESDKLTRNAFRKAIRDQLNGWAHTRTFYNDGRLDFFFRDSDGMCGGLIFSAYEDKRGHQKHTFTIHT